MSANLRNLIAWAAIAGLGACSSLNQTPRDALVRQPGARFYGKPVPVEIEAVKHTQFAALSAVAYDSAKSAAAMADQKAVTTDAHASVALGDTCESSQQELQQRKWQRWDLKFDEKLNEKFRRVHRKRPTCYGVGGNPDC